MYITSNLQFPEFGGTKLMSLWKSFEDMYPIKQNSKTHKLQNQTSFPFNLTPPHKINPNFT